MTRSTDPQQRAPSRPDFDETELGLARRRHCGWLALLPLLVTCGAACGGGAALLHGAHPLPQAEVSAGVGTHGHIVQGPARRIIQQGSASSGTHLGIDSVAAAALRASSAPGVSPWVGARAGLGHQAEAGLTYSGRTVRADARRAWTFGPWALSAGGGVSTVLAGDRDSSADEPTIDSSSQAGFLLDVPLLAGWRSKPNVVELWAGLRGGYEWLRGSLEINPRTPALEWVLDARLHRWFVGPVAGLSVGVRPVWVSVELAVSFQQIWGMVRERVTLLPARTATPEALLPDGRLRLDTSGFTITPGGALIARF